MLFPTDFLPYLALLVAGGILVTVAFAQLLGRAQSVAARGAAEPARADAPAPVGPQDAPAPAGRAARLVRLAPRVRTRRAAAAHPHETRLSA